MEEEAKNSKPHELKINDIDSKEDIINNTNEKDKWMITFYELINVKEIIEI